VSLLEARGAIVTYHDPLVPELRATDGKIHHSTAFETLMTDSNLIVVVTPHKSIDWATVYSKADLIVDTVNSSRGRVARERQVYRLGARWAAPDA
jgi:UDP-N-acetyl-D-glucosamine dehydrogenase